MLLVLHISNFSMHDTSAFINIIIQNMTFNIQKRRFAVYFI